MGAIIAGGCRHQARPHAAAHGPITSLPAGSFNRVWSSALDLPAGQSLNQLYLRHDLLWATTDRNRAYQFGASSGALQTILDPTKPGDILGKPILSDHYLLWPANSVLQVYNFAGRKIESDSMDHAFSSGGVTNGDRLFIAIHYEDHGRLLALGISDQYVETVWELQRKDAIISTPAVYENVLFVADTTGDVFAVSADDSRNPVWGGDHTFHTYAAVLADLKVDDYGLYVASTDTILYCLDRGTAKIKWQWLSGQPLYAAPVVTADTVYQLMPGNKLAAIDKISKDPQAYNRSPRWIADARQFLSADATHVYVLGTNHHLVALDKQTGQVQFRSIRSDFEAAAINPQSATIYAATRGGVVTAISPVLRAGVVGEQQ
jgi:outer membrane protein assembly factor BamB